MKSTVKIYIAALFAVLAMGSFSVQAQTFSSGNGTGNNFLNNSKPQLTVSLSSSFISFGPEFNSFGTSIFPQMTIPVSNKFSLNTGIGYSTFFVGGGNEGAFQRQQSSYGHVFVSGKYRVNKKISLRGTAFKTFMLAPSKFETETTPMFYDFSSQGVIMDVEYKVTDNFRINVGFEYREQKYPMFRPGVSPTTSFMDNPNPFSGFNRHNGFHSF